MNFLQLVVEKKATSKLRANSYARELSLKSWTSVQTCAVSGDDWVFLCLWGNVRKMPFANTHSHQRSAAATSEPTRRHLRITEEQIDELLNGFHPWRSVRDGQGCSIAASSIQENALCLPWLFGIWRIVSPGMNLVDEFLLIAPVAV